tara:strand:+ start:283 stop:495 length:213 start_codon:yes stop_codon:yes gene_type:complete
MKIRDPVNSQKQFEQFIEILIAYKKCHLDEDVYVNLNTLDKSMKWYHSIVKGINPEMITELKKNLEIGQE